MAVKANHKSEKDIKREIVTFLKYNNIFCWVQPSTGIYDVSKGRFRSLNGYGMRRGVCDVLGIYRGKFLAIEVKVPGGEPSSYQKMFMNDVSWNGGIAFVATSIEDVRRELGI